MGQGDADGAIADATRTIELRPNQGEGYLNRGMARAAQMPEPRKNGRKPCWNRAGP